MTAAAFAQDEPPGTITFSFQGCGSDSEQCSGDWGYQRIDYNFEIKFEVVGVNPTQADGMVTYQISSKIGTVRFYGTAQDNFWGETTGLKFDETKQYEIEITEGTLRYPAAQPGNIQIEFQIPPPPSPDPSHPYATYIEYDGGLGIVRTTVNMPDPWATGTGCLSNKYEVPNKSCCGIEINIDKEPLSPGESTEVHASGTEISPGQPLQWEITRLEGCDVKAKISPDGNLGQTATITDVEGYGWVNITVTNPALPDCRAEKWLKIGCDCNRSDQSCANKGGGYFGLAHVATRLGLGRTARGKPAGGLYLPTATCDPLAATPQLLKIDLTGENVDTVFEDGVLRQVKAPESFVDIIVVDELSYNIYFYGLDNVAVKVGGLYQLVPGAVPFVTWTVEDADGSQLVCERLKMTETRNGRSRVFEYTWNEAEGTWSLRKGNGLQVVTRKEEIINATRVVTETIKNDAGIIASKVRTTYADIPLGSGSSEEIIEIVQDPDDATLTTTREWYQDPCPAGSCGRLKAQINPDGSWVTYQYDSQGRKTLEIRSWLDIPFGAAASSASALYYDYTPHAGDSQAAQDKRLPRTVTEEILGNAVGRTYYVYAVAADGTRTEIVERASSSGAPYGHSGNQRTVTEHYPFSDSRPDSWKVKSFTYPDGRLDKHTYEYGTYTPAANPLVRGTFTEGAGTDVRERIVHGTITQPSGIPYKTTGEMNVTNDLGDLLWHQTYVYVSGEYYSPIQWVAQIHDDVGHVTKAGRSDGTLSESTWDCCGKDSEIDSRGITKFFTHDALDLLTSATKDADDDIITSYIYDAVGRRLSQTTTAGSLSLSGSSVYDTAGRLEQQTDTSGLVTRYAYSLNGLTVTVTRPGGATEITERYPDGRVKSISGTAVTPRYYTYDVNADGTQWTRVDNGSASSPMWEKTTTDMLGRTIRVEKPGYTGIETTEYFYNDLGQMVRTTTTGLANTLYTYDEVGNQVRSGLDINNNGVLDLEAQDRINENQSVYVQYDNEWWEETVQKVYAMENDGSATVVNTSRNRLTGLGADGVVSETVSIDIHGNQAVAKVVIDRSARTTTRTTDYPDSTVDALSVSTNGLLTSSTSKTGVTTSYTYDPLERQTGMTDPRTGPTITAYDAREWVESVHGPAGNRTDYTYDADTGRKTVETNALGKAVRFAYNDRGQITRTWGDAVYPVEYAYDTYGRMTEMRTWRSDEDWAGESWPEGAAGSADPTKWHYQDSTGLLVGKEDDAGKGATYTYGAGWRLASRTWARTEGSSPLVTAYTYDPNTGELLEINYSDATPDITFTYDRLGRQLTVTDAVGTRGFDYNTALQLETETITGLYGKVITRTYENATVIGRPAGFNTGADYSITYGYDTAGRFNSVGWNVEGVSNSATYAYLPNSDLLHQMTTDNGLQTTYTYERQRDVRTRIRNEFGANVISQYDYQYDLLGRRSSVVNSGQAFAAVNQAFNLYRYNDRNELVESARYLGPDTSNTSSPVSSEYRAYNYDPIGNRIQHTESADTGTYATNGLNQYTQQVPPQGVTSSFAYDDDGNLTETNKGSVATQYQYNAENRLIAVEPATPVDGDKKLEFTYDYMGRRVNKKVSTYTSDSWLLTSNFLSLYEGWNMVSEWPAAGGPPDTKYYVWGLDLSQSHQGAGGVGGLIASFSTLPSDLDSDGVVDGSDLVRLISNPGQMDMALFNSQYSQANPSSTSGFYGYYFFFDGNGDIGQLVNTADGEVASHYEYDPYGNVVVSVGSLADDNPYRFSSKYYDIPSGLYYYGYRYYSPELGRWVNRDPIGERGGNNLYGFVGNDGVNVVDLFGLSWTVDGTLKILCCTEQKESLDLVRRLSELDVVIFEESYKEVKFKDDGTTKIMRVGEGTGVLRGSAEAPYRRNFLDNLFNLDNTRYAAMKKYATVIWIREELDDRWAAGRLYHEAEHRRNPEWSETKVRYKEKLFLERMGLYVDPKLKKDGKVSYDLVDDKVAKIPEYSEAARPRGFQTVGRWYKGEKPPISRESWDCSNICCTGEEEKVVIDTLDAKCIE